LEIALERLGQPESREPQAVAARIAGEDLCAPSRGQLELVARPSLRERGVSQAKLDDPVVAGMTGRRGREV
jgi:hypothetical protein